MTATPSPTPDLVGAPANSAPDGDAAPRAGSVLFRVGCAMWSHPAWASRHAPPHGWDLQHYASWCRTVEGNTTFYATPEASTIERWLDDTPEDFRFCFKLPRSITHDRRLRNCADELTGFLSAIEPLRERLGPIQVQLPASFGPEHHDLLTSFLHAVPESFEWAVELRHPDFFVGGSHERIVDDVFQDLGVNRVILDSRVLFDGPRQTAEEIDAWQSKPRLPVRPVATGSSPIVRLIGQRDLDRTVAGWDQWIGKIAAWVAAGKTPFVFTHTPDNVDAPPLARRIEHAIDRELIGSHDLHHHLLADPATADQQLDLWSVPHERTHS